jgi:hypothetical protein
VGIVFAGDPIYSADVSMPEPKQVANGDNGSGFTSATPSNGTTTCGVSFVAPPSGRVLVMAQGAIQLASGTGQFYGGPRIRTGGTPGSGSDVYDPSVLDPGIRFGSSSAQTLNGSCVGMVSGLTPGSTYNVCFVVWIQAGSSPSLSYFGRQVAVTPLP